MSSLVVAPWLLDAIDDSGLDLKDAEEDFDGSDETTYLYYRVSERSNRSVKETRLWVMGVVKDPSGDGEDRTLLWLRLIGVDEGFGGMGMRK